VINISDYPSLSSVMRFFEEISSVPRASGNREPIANYLCKFAADRGLEHSVDKAFNVIIKKDATQGYENLPAVILQGHTDMVPAKNELCVHDFDSEGVKLYRDGDFLRGVGTTLGGDDGVAVAYALAILDAKDIPHPAIEAIFTSDEEIGLLGAVDLENCDKLKGNMLINIDSDEEGIFTVGCAGGVRVDLEFKAHREGFLGESYKLTVSGLAGGHSGVEIDKKRLNANRILFSVLADIYEVANIRILSISGGNADNAISREAECLFVCDELSPSAFDAVSAAYRRFRKAEPNINVSIDECESPLETLCAEHTEQLINLGFNLPNGVISCFENDGAVKTSLNMGILSTEGDVFKISYSVRSASGEEKKALCKEIKDTAEKYGATYSEHGAYPAWEYREESPLRDAMCEVYRRMYGKDAKVVTIHAGLECGILSEKIKDLDCVSIGPDNFDIHTTEERLSLSSTARVYEYLLELLKSFKKEN